MSLGPIRSRKALIAVAFCSQLDRVSAAAARASAAAAAEQQRDVLRAEQPDRRPRRCGAALERAAAPEVSAGAFALHFFGIQIDKTISHQSDDGRAVPGRQPEQRIVRRLLSLGSRRGAAPVRRAVLQQPRAVSIKRERHHSVGGRTSIPGRRERCVLRLEPERQELPFPPLGDRPLDRLSIVPPAQSQMQSAEVNVVASFHFCPSRPVHLSRPPSINRH